MKVTERLAVVVTLACVSAVSFSFAATKSTEPNAAELVRAVRESENWLHRIDSLQLRVEGRWSHPPESITARRAELKKRSPDEEPDPQRDWSLKPSYSDRLEYAIDFKRERLRYVEDTPGSNYFLYVWDGKHGKRYAKRVNGYQQYDLDSTTKMFEKIFGSLSWPRAQPHSFWWDPEDVEQTMHWFGRENDFRITGRADYRGVTCYVLEYSPPNDPTEICRWYVGTEDRLLYGRVTETNAGSSFEYWTLDYKEVKPGCPIPMTQGYCLKRPQKDKRSHYIDFQRDVKILEVNVNGKLQDGLFQMEFVEGLPVYDRQSGKFHTHVDVPPSVIGRPLPDTAAFGIKLTTDQARNKRMLICFWDMQQRPSRNCIMQLAKQAQQLKDKRVTIIAVQALKVDENKLDEWVEEYRIPFPIGMVRADADKARFAWGVKSLPWLILTDREHIVRAEGFGLNELDEKIENTTASRENGVQRISITGLVKDPQGQALSNVRVTEFQTDKAYITDGDGKFVSAYGPSENTRYFFAVHRQRELVGVGQLAARQRHVEIDLVSAKMVSGTVVDPDGKPVAGAQVAALPMTCFYVLTDGEGKFDVGWNPEWARDLKEFFLMARHLERNLAGGVEFNQDTKTVRTQLEPALTLAGTVEDSNGVPIPEAKVGLSLRRGWACGTPVKSTITDKQGRYEFRVLPQQQEYINYAEAGGYFKGAITTGIINRITDCEKVGPIILKKANLSVSGVVIDDTGKPVANCPVGLRGAGQPQRQTKTDAQGRFTLDGICSGDIEIWAKLDNVLYGTLQARAGQKKVRLVVSPMRKPDSGQIKGTCEGFSRV